MAEPVTNLLASAPTDINCTLLAGFNRVIDPKQHPGWSCQDLIPLIQAVASVRNRIGDRRGRLHWRSQYPASPGVMRINLTAPIVPDHLFRRTADLNISGTGGGSDTQTLKTTSFPCGKGEPISPIFGVRTTGPVGVLRGSGGGGGFTPLNNWVAVSAISCWLFSTRSCIAIQPSFVPT